MRWYSDEELLDWVKVGPGVGHKDPAAWEARLFMAKQTRRGYGTRPASADPTTPYVTVMVGYTERRDIGGRARKSQWTKLRAQSNYIDRESARADGFDHDGDVESTWKRVHDWADDKRYFRSIISPLEGERVKDWRAYMHDFMAAVNDRLFTSEERRDGFELDWTATLHTNTDHPHLHALIRGKVDNKDLWLAPGFVADLPNLARSVAADERHLGRQSEQSTEAVADAVKAMERDLKRENRTMGRVSRSDGLELD
jgi:hypothetical protein